MSHLEKFQDKPKFLYPYPLMTFCLDILHDPGTLYSYVSFLTHLPLASIFHLKECL